MDQHKKDQKRHVTHEQLEDGDRDNVHIVHLRQRQGKTDVGDLQVETQQAAPHTVETEDDKVTLVGVAHAWCSEEAMVVTFQDALATVATVVRARRSVQLTGGAVCPSYTHHVYGEDDDNEYDAQVLLILKKSTNPWICNVTTSMVGLKNSCIYKSLNTTPPPPQATKKGGTPKLHLGMQK